MCKTRKIQYVKWKIVPGPGCSLALSSSLDVCPLELESTSLTPESAGLGGSEPEINRKKYATLGKVPRGISLAVATPSECFTRQGHRSEATSIEFIKRREMKNRNFQAGQ